MEKNHRQGVWNWLDSDQFLTISSSYCESSKIGKHKTLNLFFFYIFLQYFWCKIWHNAVFMRRELINKGLESGKLLGSMKDSFNKTITPTRPVFSTFMWSSLCISMLWNVTEFCKTFWWHYVNLFRRLKCDILELKFQSNILDGLEGTCAKNQT